MVDGPENSQDEYQEALYVVMRDDNCKKITISINSESTMTGNDFIQHLNNFIEQYEEGAQDLLDESPCISEH